MMHLVYLVCICTSWSVTVYQRFKIKCSFNLEFILWNVLIFVFFNLEWFCTFWSSLDFRHFFLISLIRPLTLLVPTWPDPFQAMIGGSDSKIGGGGGGWGTLEYLIWLMSFPQGVGKGGRNEKQLYTWWEALFKMSICMLNLMVVNKVGPSV